MVKTIFFDFGGCIDAPGIHTRTLFWEAFLAEGVQLPSQRASFQEAYTKADQRMMGTGEACSLRLAEFNRHNSLLIADELGLAAPAAEAAAARVTEQMRGFLQSSREALAPLRGKYELGVISNFTGNLELILREFQLAEFFQSVTESYYVGASKPEPKIFLEALAKQGNPPGNCVYVGDNPVNDIAPAKALGMLAVLIHPPGKRQECGADFYLENLRDLSSWIQTR